MFNAQEQRTSREFERHEVQVGGGRGLRARVAAECERRDAHEAEEAELLAAATVRGPPARRAPAGALDTHTRAHAPPELLAPPLPAAVHQVHTRRRTEEPARQRAKRSTGVLTHLMSVRVVERERLEIRSSH